MGASTSGPLAPIRRVLVLMQAADIPVWLFGGCGPDARLGRITRDHGDVQFWVERDQESCEFSWDGVPFSTAYFDRQPGTTITLEGRWSDWELPAGASATLRSLIQHLR